MLNETKKILLATDLSEDCRNAYTHAFDIANACNGQIVLFHVITASPIASSLERRIDRLLGKGGFDTIMTDYASEARSVLIGKRKEIDIIRNALAKFRTALSRFSGDAKATPTGEPLPDDEVIVRNGDDVVEEILSVVQEKEIDMIVLSAHAKTSDEANISKMMFQLLRLARVPVTIVPPIRI
ncbi:putative UspA4 [Desulfosarcina cetonica]|uniref:universal stress protein n=1 Tax=Desulfosarcina cetonica TaxID=90730 RepID=UPI0006CFE3B1|nr:universal stress protein [Desulfosarcina cetonica]VTR65957.1 putative UspA4 [Desulfosarcina cetonica]